MRASVLDYSTKWQSTVDVTGRYLALTSSSATLNGRTEAAGDQLPVRVPRNPRSEADRGWLQRLVRLVLDFRDLCRIETELIF